MKLNMLLETTGEGTNTSNSAGASGWIMLVIVGLLIVLMVVRMFSDRKRQGKAEEMLNELKVGDKVVTNAGIYGEIVSIRQTNCGKVALIKSGEGKNASYISVNLQVILGIDEKQDVVLDANGNVVESASETAKAETKTQTKKPVEEPKEAKDEKVDNVEEETEKKEPSKKRTRTKKDN